MKSISVKTQNGYDVLVGTGLLENAADHISEVVRSKKAVIVSDDIVDRLYSSVLEKSLISSGYEIDKFVFKNGEPSKCHTTLVELYEFLASVHISRKDFIVALGGGVVGDLAGFAAATYLRGIDFVQIPTTLLAQIDSSVGGKTAVDIEAGKNLVGAFWQPKLVLCDIDCLSTLSDDIFADGMAEAIKYGVIKSRTLFDKIEKYSEYKSYEDLEEIITECIKIKADVVAEDEFDTGERMLLNFGHTLGHGIEQHYNYSKYTHGSAVAIGMYEITLLCEKYGICEADCAEKIKRLLIKYSLPFKIDFDINELSNVCLNDKKRQSGSMNIIVPETVGNAKILKMSIDDFQRFILGEWKK